jgi:hypothetical protein
LATGGQKNLMDRRSPLMIPEFSPAGDQIAFMQAIAGDVQIFTMSVNGADIRQITRGKGELNGLPRWSADGSSVYYYRFYPSPSFRKVPAGGGADSEVAVGWRWETHNAAREDPRGGRLVYTLIEGNHDVATNVRDLKTGAETRLGEILNFPRWSPDGSAVVGTLANQSEMRICPASGGACASLGRGGFPVWDHDGATIYFWRLGATQKTADLWSMGLTTRSVKQLATLGPFSPVEGFFDVSRASQVITAQFREGRTELWLADIKR